MLVYRTEATELYLMKPLEREFEVSDAGVRHRPTDEKFVPYPGKPSDGSWRDGHLDTAGEYDQEEVRKIGRKLWARFVASRPD
jgi:hypothetical protein